MDETQKFISENKQRFLDELIELLKIPSVSADPAYNQDVLNTADKVAEYLNAAGADNVEVCETNGYPVVYGEKLLTRLYRPFLFMDTMTYNHRTLWIFGNRGRLNLS